MSERNRELFALIPASLLITAGFAGVFIQRSNALSNISLTYGAIKASGMRPAIFSLRSMAGSPKGSTRAI